MSSENPVGPSRSRLYLLNGVYGAPEHFEALQVALAPAIETRVFPFRREGLADPTPEHGFSPMVDRLATELDRCDGDRAPALFGFSLGGALALEYALTHPGRVSALILVNAFARYRQGPVATGSLPALRAWPPAWAHPEATARIVHQVRWLRRSLFHAEAPREAIERGVRAATAAVSQGDLLFQLAHLGLAEPAGLAGRVGQLSRDLPILLASSRHDRVVPPFHTDWLATQLPWARRTRFEGGHAFFQHDAALLAHTVREFLEAL
ncbi:MAG TPA: alpha/beta hydrolase [Candidatus Limnocylindria bacterium]|nr:alpha/beta hydrolase [Candidatus Limnocylindria bacterium]